MKITPAELSEIQNMIAALVNEHGVDRIITQEVLEERCLHYFNVAKQELQECKPDTNPDRSDFCPTATVFGANGAEAPNVRVGFSEGKKRQMMWALSQTCKTMLAQAVIIRIVATTCNMETLAKAMELNLPDPRDRQKFDYFEERMWKWITQHYGKPRLSALPPEFRRDVINVAGMGPNLCDCGVLAEYEWKNGNLIVGKPWMDGSIKNEMIPRWWQ